MHLFTHSDQLAFLQSLLDLPVEAVVHHNDHQEPGDTEPDDLAAHQIHHRVGCLTCALYGLQALEQLVMLLLKELHLVVQVLVVGLVGKHFKLHEFQPGLQLERNAQWHVQQVSSAE